MSTLSLVPVSSLLGRVPRGDDPDALHRAVMGLFASVPDNQPGPRRERLGVLWRLERDGNVLIRSRIAPTNLPQRARTRDEPDHALRRGDRVLFRVAVNAIHRHAAKAGGGHQPVEDVEAWLAERLAPSLVEVAVFAHERSVGRSPRRGLVVQRDLVDGAAVVEDAEALTVLLASGVGRAKAFGCGLLTVARA